LGKFFSSYSTDGPDIPRPGKKAGDPAPGNCRFWVFSKGFSTNFQRGVTWNVSFPPGLTPPSFRPSPRFFVGWCSLLFPEKPLFCSFYLGATLDCRSFGKSFFPFDVPAQISPVFFFFPFRIYTPGCLKTPPHLTPRPLPTFHSRFFFPHRENSEWFLSCARGEKSWLL